MLGHEKTRVNPLTWWTSEFIPVAPIGHVLRCHLHENWTRFHSLPESKRYPESAAEYKELLKRHLAIASELFRFGEPIYLYRSYYDEKRIRGKSKYQVAQRLLQARMVRLPSDLHVEHTDLFYVRALETIWVPDFFENLVRQVADEMEFGITFVSPISKNIYCPYDGGMDIFTASVSCLALESKCHTWMSARSDKQ